MIININITNSFNKKEKHELEKNKVPDNFLFQNQNFNKVNAETNSLNATSITNNTLQGFTNIGLKNIKSSIWRDVFVKAVSAIIGAIITFLVLGIK